MKGPGGQAGAREGGLGEGQKNAKRLREAFGVGFRKAATTVWAPSYEWE